MRTGMMNFALIAILLLFKTMMASVDPVFRSVQKNKSGFYIWRIENMNVVPVPKEMYGQFFKGDSYIALSIKEAKGAMDTHIHFWLGEETSAEEAGVAAYKAVELNDFLGGSPIKHREVQGSESDLFLNYFKERGGVRYLAGGVKSNHVDKPFKERLLHLKGKHHVRVSEVPLSWNSMNHGDVFIIDLGKVLFLWTGKEASRTEKRKLGEHSRQLRDGRGEARIVFVEDGDEEKGLTAEEKKLFEMYLPLSEKGNVKSKEEGGVDEVNERKAASELKLYVCSEEEGTLKVSEVKSGPLSKKDLDTGDTYIIDNGSCGIWAWIGKKSSTKERKEAMRNALGFIKKKNLPKNTKVTRVVEGVEPSEFKCLFKDWPMPPITGKVYSRNRIVTTLPPKTECFSKVDLVFILDSSTNVGEGNYKKMLQFCKDFLHAASIDTGDVRVGLVSYSTSVIVEFQMNEYSTKQQIYDAIDHIPWRYGSSNTADALQTMHEDMFTIGNGDRPDVKNLAIIVTDGVSNINSRRTIPEAEAARAKNIHIYAIGIGLTDVREVNGIASIPAEDNAFFVKNFDELEGLDEDIFQSLCDGRILTSREEVDIDRTPCPLGYTRKCTETTCDCIKDDVCDLLPRRGHCGGKVVLR